MQIISSMTTKWIGGLITLNWLKTKHSPQLKLKPKLPQILFAKNQENKQNTKLRKSGRAPNYNYTLKTITYSQNCISLSICSAFCKSCLTLLRVEIDSSLCSSIGEASSVFNNGGEQWRYPHARSSSSDWSHVARTIQRRSHRRLAVHRR